MKGNKIKDNKRLRTLASYNLLDTPPEKLYDDITQLAASICDTEISLITLIDDTRQFFKSHHGIDFNQTELDVSFCKHLIGEDLDELIVSDAKHDPRFQDHTFIVSGAKISFYAGFSLNAPNGNRIGALCVIDRKPKELNENQKATLRTLAHQVVQSFELQRIKTAYTSQEAKSKEKDRLFKSITESNRIGLWECHGQTNYVKFNKEGANIIGYYSHGPKEITKDTWEKHVHSSDLPIIKEKRERCFANSKEVYDVSYRMFQKNGNLIWVQETGRITGWDHENKPLSMQGTIKNITEKVTHDTELEKIKNNQEALINGTKDLLWSVDTDFKLIIANKPFEQVMQAQLKRKVYKGESVLPKELSKKTIEKWKSYYTRAMKGEQFTIKEKIEDLSEPSATYGLISLSPMYDKKGMLLGVSCFSKDITYEVIAQQEILTAKENLDKIMDTSLDIICTVDEQGYFLTINTACKRIWGYEPKEVVGKKYTDFVYHEDIKASRKLEKKIVSGKKIKNFENRYVHKKNHLVPMRWSANWDKDEKKMYCIARDNTENKKTELQLEQSERRFKTLVQEGTELIAIFDQDANFSYVSPTSKKTLKMTPETLLGTNAFTHIHPDDHEAVYTQFLETLENTQVYIRPFRFKNGEGKWRWLETIATNQLEEPSIQGIVANTRDVTDRVLYLKAIEEQNKALKEIAWNQSHVVRAPVARLMGLIDLIKEEGTYGSEKRQILNYIKVSAEEIDNVIKNNVERTSTIIDIDKI